MTSPVAFINLVLSVAKSLKSLNISIFIINTNDPPEAWDCLAKSLKPLNIKTVEHFNGILYIYIYTYQIYPIITLDPKP